MRTACTIGTFALTASLLIAPLSTSAQPQQQPKQSDDALYVYSAGIDSLLVDPKDAGLLRALKMLDERVLELPNEIDDQNMPAPAIGLVMELLMSPMNLRAGLLDMNGEMQGPPFYGQISFFGSADGAANYAGRFAGMLREHGAPPASPAEGKPGMQMVDADGVPLYFGTMNSGRDGAFVVGVNRVDDPNVTVNTSLPMDVKPAMVFMLDSRKLQPVMDMLLEQAGPEAEMVKAQMAMTGMYGPDAGQIIAAIGHGKDRSHARATFTNYRKMMEKAGMLPEGSITSEDLNRVPADATYAQVGKVNLSGVMNMLKTMASQAMAQQGMGGDDAAADPFKFVEDAIGIHPQRDIFDHIGQTIGTYMSDTTGGGGLASLVLFAKSKDDAALEATRARVRGMINQIGQDQARGYVRVAERDIAGHKALALTFPGLPVPIEICSAVVDGWIYVAGSPNALNAAIAQGTKGSGSLNDNANFKEMGGGDLKDAMQVTFVDTPRMLRSGYGLVSMGMTALGNAVRSPTDLQRDAGLIMPSFNELSKDAKATVSVMRIVGDDMVMTSQGDRSMLVNAAGAAGAMGGMTGMLAAAAIAGGITMPAMTQARESAVEMQGMSQLRQIAMSFVMYAADNDDALPTSRDQLTGPGYLDAALLTSPKGEALDDEGSIWLNLKGGKTGAIQEPSQYIIAYDRAMFSTGDTVSVAFLDGHVEVLGIDALRELTLSDAHKGIDFKLPY